MTKITLWDARGEYLEHLKAQGFSTSTVHNHEIILNHGVDLWGNLDVRDITAGHVDRFRGRTWATSTSNIYLLALRGFFGFLRRADYIGKDVDPTSGWSTRRTERRQRTWLTIPELRDLFDAAWCERDRAFIALGTFTFLRGSEIAALTVGDLDLAADEIDVYRIKGRTSDRLPVCTELRDEMTTWLAYYREQCGPLADDWLLVPARGPVPMRGIAGGGGLEATGEPAPLKPTSRVTKPHEIVRRAMRDIGFDRLGDGAHVLRRSGARNLFERLRTDGHDGALRRVSSMLGHSSVVITEHYLGIDSERRQRNALLAGKSMWEEAA